MKTSSDLTEEELTLVHDGEACSYASQQWPESWQFLSLKMGRIGPCYQKFIINEWEFNFFNNYISALNTVSEETYYFFTDESFWCQLQAWFGALDTQIGGEHYKKYEIQPVEFCQKNRLPTCEANAIKYICRHRDKGGAEDVKKAIHYLQLLLEMEYGE